MGTTGFDRCYVDGGKDVGKFGKRGFGKTNVAGEIYLNTSNTIKYSPTELFC